MYTFLCYPKCITCRKAQKWLDTNGVSYMPRHIKDQNPTADELRRWQRTSGLPLKKFFNTSGQLYRNMGLAAKLADLSEEEQLALLATDGMLVKRPLLIAPSAVLVGFQADKWARTLGGDE